MSIRPNADGVFINPSLKALNRCHQFTLPLTVTKM